MKMLTQLTALTLAAIAQTGCTRQQVKTDFWGPLDAMFGKAADTRQSDDPIVFADSGPLAIDVDTFAGDVYIEAHEEWTDTVVTVIRESKHGRYRSDEGEASLGDIGYEAEVVPGDVAPVLQVRTWTSHGEPYFQRAHVYISIPAAQGVTIRTSRSKVEAVNVQGEVDIETSRQGVRVMSRLPMRDKVTILNKDGGDIDYRVRGESTGYFTCATVGGKVDMRSRNGVTRIHTAEPDRLVASLNHGDNPIHLHTVDGNIRVAVVKDPTKVGFFIFDP